MNAADSIGPNAPVFFFSYARPIELRNAPAPTGVDADIRQFFTRLSEDVAQLLPPLPGEDPGFMDVALRGGTIWSPDILRAAGTCQVFVAMLSPAYFESTWCAMEWDLFARRQVRARSDDRSGRATAIIPVLWAPVANGMPDRVSRVTMFSPTGIPGATERLYRDHGILGLIRMNRKAAYATVVWTLARLVVKVYHGMAVDPLLLDGLDGLRGTFEEDA